MRVKLDILKKSYVKVVTKISPKLTPYLKKELKDCDTVLELGCGKNSPLRCCNVRYSVGVELFEPSLLKSKEQKIHNEYILADIRELKFKDNSFDCVCVLDVLEHLTKEEGITLIRNMERIARLKVIIFTPNGFLPQGEEYGNPFEIHKSGWSVQELRNLGYTVRGINGIKTSTNILGRLKNAGHYYVKLFSLVLGIVNIATQRLVYRCPSLAFQLLCTKHL